MWETASWWKSANVLTILIKYGRVNEDEDIKKIVSNTFDNINATGFKLNDFSKSEIYNY
jgi:hypothetical protein